MGLKENLAYLFFFISRILHIRPYNDIPDEFIIYVIMISSTFSINSLSQKKKKGTIIQIHILMIFPYEKF